MRNRIVIEIDSDWMYSPEYLLKHLQPLLKKLEEIFRRVPEGHTVHGVRVFIDVNRAEHSVLEEKGTA